MGTTWGSWEFLLVAAGAVAALLPLVVCRRDDRKWLWCAAGAGVLLLAAGILPLTAATSRRHESAGQLVAAVPDRGLAVEGFVSSDACRACHPSNYETWHDSFHRTMTQVATPDAVIGDFDGVTLQSRGRTYYLSRDEDEFRVDMVDPEWEHNLLDKGLLPPSAADPPRMTKRIVMTTGSHHMQTYWVASNNDGRLFNFPFVWLPDDNRWAPREDVFLRPESFGRQFGTWHNNCIECHAVAGEQHRRNLAYDPEVAELGIACEACHGPAGEHIRVNADPARRYRYRMSGDPDPTIVNPAHLPAPAAAQVCGQCHGIHVFKNAASRAGLRYRAGGDITETRIPLRTSDRYMPDDERPDWTRLQQHIQRQTPTFIEERLWPDGMVRVSGREYNALTGSACFMGGQLSCLSCHSMHDSDPNDQLAVGMNGDRACLGCHASIGSDLESHTHHLVESAGSRCYNCHMPHTTYGLLKAIRSHGIDSPTVASSIETGRPNACNLCHLDRTMRWAADHLTDWYGQAPVQLSEDRETVSAAVLWLLTGDANQRALIAWHMGWGPAMTASGHDWFTPYLGHTLADPYACVRYIAHRSLRRQPGLADFAYDFVGTPQHRSDARVRAINTWTTRASPSRHSGPQILIDETGSLDRTSLTGLSRQRNDRAVDLRE